MIKDKDTNYIYFSSLIKENKKYLPFWERIKLILLENNIPFGFIENTRDIWCRDYMPIQLNSDEFIQFTYFPEYLLTPKNISKLTLQNEIRTIDRINKKESKLILDGGNIVSSGKIALITQKVFEENKNLEKKTVISLLEKALKVDKIFILPKQPYDYTGHADGMVKFIDENTILVSDYSAQKDYWIKEMDSVLKNTGLNIKTFPSEIVTEKNTDGDYTAKGVYINFLRVGNIVLVPQFNLNSDKIAIEKATKYFPDCKIIPLLSNEIATDGGVINCVTWNIRINTVANLNKLPKKIPNFKEQENYVNERLGFYLSSYDYNLISKGFEYAWNNSTGEISGDSFFKRFVYGYIESILDYNFIPQDIVDKTIDLILEYLESIGQYGFDISEN